MKKKKNLNKEKKKSYMSQVNEIRKIDSVGPKDLGTPAHFISSPRPTPRRKKCPRTNKGNPDC